jgi:putative oxidoreductase
MNTALVVLRLVVGVLFVGHGLQKLVPPKYSPRLLRAFGLQATADRFDGLGVRPALPAALLAGTAELVGGFSIAAGLLTPLGTLLITAVMTTAIVTVHFANGIWNADGGFEFNLTLVACAYVVSALGPGSHSLDNAFDVGNWAGVHWSMSTAGRAGIVVAIGAVCGLLPVIAAAMTRPGDTDRPVSSFGQTPRRPSKTVGS